MKVRDLVQSRHEVFLRPRGRHILRGARYRARSAGAVCWRTGLGRPSGRRRITQRYFKIKSPQRNKCPAWMRVSEIMVQRAGRGPARNGLDECLCLMEKHGVFHLLVVEDSGRYLGMISVGGPAPGHLFGSQSSRRHV